jgi:hypothetical protein
MKKTRSIVLFIAAMLCSVHLFAQTEQLTVPLTNPGKSYSLDVNLLNGSIKVSSYPGKDILIEVTQMNAEIKQENKADDNGMKRISGSGGYAINASENNNVVTVHNNNFGQTVNLSLKIPRDVKLKLQTVNNGDLEVEGVTGELELNNVNGAIRAANISGSVVGTTVNGDIIVTFVTVEQNASMAFSTLTGNVDITFPATFQANLKLKSDMGEMFSDFDLVIDKSQPVVNRAAQSGMYKLEMEDWVYGKINGGGPEFLLKNMQGNIYIRKAK